MIAIGSDRAGYDLKGEIIRHLEEKGLEYVDCGCGGETPILPKRSALR